MRRNVIIYVLTVLISIIFIIGGNYIATKDYDFLTGQDSEATSVGEVIEITKVEDYEYNEYMGGKTITFDCFIKKGENKNKIVEAIQIVDDYDQIPAVEVKEGDKVVLYDYGEDGGLQFASYSRTTPIIWLGVIFAILLLVFGRQKGFNTLVSLFFTCMAVFFVFIPSVLSGYNIYLWSIITCIFVITMTLIIVSGADRKTLVAITGCLCGVLLAGVLTYIMDKILGLTGIVDESAYYLTMLNPDSPINLKGVIFASITIGAMGAIMDVSMSISSALYEVKRKSGVKSSELIGSGFAIGRDMMGTMANTLVLAYIGSSLSVALLLVAYNGSFVELMNKEMVIVEVLQALVGSIGILFTIPFTTILCVAFFKDNDKDLQKGDVEEDDEEYY